MFTKSRIQMIKEGFEIANSYRNSLQELMEKYIIEDSIFVYKNGQVFEATKGYFEVVNEYDNLADAIRECVQDMNNMGIRIVNNTSFTVGYIRKTISECSNESSIMDINNLFEIR